MLLIERAMVQTPVSDEKVNQLPGNMVDFYHASDVSWVRLTDIEGGIRGAVKKNICINKGLLCRFMVESWKVVDFYRSWLILSVMSG
ncbi:MAG: hypothetical protein H7837_01195 [Magnetococcus sp. MYC-9]